MVYYVKTGYYNTKKYKGYDSKFEAGYAEELELRKKAGEIKDFEEQKTLDLISNGYKIGTYKIDFVVYHHDETIEYVETKGYATPVWRLKWKVFESMYGDDPNITLTVVKQGKFYLRKPKKLTTK